MMFKSAQTKQEEKNPRETTKFFSLSKLGVCGGFGVSKNASPCGAGVSDLNLNRFSGFIQFVEDRFEIYNKERAREQLTHEQDDRVTNH